MTSRIPDMIESDIFARWMRVKGVSASVGLAIMRTFCIIGLEVMMVKFSSPASASETSEEVFY